MKEITQIKDHLMWILKPRQKAVVDSNIFSCSDGGTIRTVILWGFVCFLMLGLAACGGSGSSSPAHIEDKTRQSVEEELADMLTQS